MQELITVTEASDIILKHLKRSQPTEMIPLDQATGRYLTRDLHADRPLPPFDRVMMDGIAIRHSAWALGKRRFPISAVQAAGQVAAELADHASCIEVMTGGVLPRGCDCVIPVEEISLTPGQATIHETATPRVGQHIHPLGSDTSAGATLLSTGQRLSAPELTIAASCGVTSLPVASLPKISLVSTGDELVAPEASPLPHQIRRSHATALRASIASHHLGTVTEQHAPDDPAQLESILRQALENSDILVLTGGVSRGKYDFVAPVLNKLLGRPRFHGVAQRPGKPLAYWAGGEHPPVFALPGNPVSVMACAARYLLPALSFQLNGSLPEPRQLPAQGQFNCPPHFTGLIPCQIQHGMLKLVPPSNSGNFLSLAGTHGVAELPGKLSQTRLDKSPATFYPW